MYFIFTALFVLTTVFVCILLTDCARPGAEWLAKFILGVIFLAALIVSGCGSHCITVGGTHENSGVSGDFTYCWNTEESETTGTPAFNVTLGDKAQETVYGFSRDLVDRINDKFEKWFGEVGLRAKRAQHPVLRLKELVDRKDDK